MRAVFWLLIRSDDKDAGFPDQCKKTIKKQPRILKQIYFDSIIFTQRGCGIDCRSGRGPDRSRTDYPFPWSVTPVEQSWRARLSDDDRMRFSRHDEQAAEKFRVTMA